MGSVDLSWAWPWVSSQLESQLGQIRPLFTQSLILQGVCLGFFHGTCRAPRTIRKQVPRWKHFSICFCHMYHCSIGQNKSVVKLRVCVGGDFWSVWMQGGVNQWGCYWDLHTVLTHPTYGLFWRADIWPLLLFLRLTLYGSYNPLKSTTFCNSYSCDICNTSVWMPSNFKIPSLYPSLY